MIVPQTVEINNLYTDTGSALQYATVDILAQEGAAASNTDVNTALQIDNLVPATETLHAIVKPVR